jgi:hypothetical protein
MYKVIFLLRTCNDLTHAGEAILDAQSVLDLYFRDNQPGKMTEEGLEAFLSTKEGHNTLIIGKYLRLRITHNL